MKVLVPLPYDVSRLAHGRNLRIVYLLQELARTHLVTCLTPDQRTAQAVCSVLVDIRVVPANLQHTYACDMPPMSQSRNFTFLAEQPLLRKALDFLGYDEQLLNSTVAWAPGFDAVLGFDTPSVAYLLGVAEHATIKPEIICDMIDDPWLNRKSLPRRHRWSTQGLKAATCIKLLRKKALPRFDTLIAVARKDADCLSRAAGKSVHVIPNGVHLPPMTENKLNNDPLILFTGAMDFPPNESAAVYLVRKIWPRVLSRFNTPSTEQVLGIRKTPKLVIAGANPTRKVQKLAKVPGVQVTGFVPDLRARLSTARLAVAPMVSGCGMKNKVLEACAAGCPVVATPMGAAGLPHGEEMGILVGRSANRMAEMIFQLLANSRRAEAIGSAGRRMVHQQFSWPGAGKLLNNLLTKQDQRRTAQPAGKKKPATNDSPSINKEAVAYATS